MILATENAFTVIMIKSAAFTKDSGYTPLEHLYVVPLFIDSQEQVTRFSFLILVSIKQVLNKPLRLSSSAVN